MKSRLFLFTLIALLIGLEKSWGQQSYKTALGLRLNGGAGISCRHFISEKHSIEGILYSRWRGVNITGLYTVNTPVFAEPGFSFFIGGGAHLGIWDSNRSPWWDDNEYKDNSRLVMGVDGQIGLEYVFEEIPLNLSVDWKPALNFIGVTNFWAGDAALSVRYTF